MGLEGFQGRRLAGPTTQAQLLGVADTISAHPLMLIAGLALGGWLAHKHISPWGAIWGEHHGSHSRAKALTGSKAKNRKKRRHR
jgi:hypothetical protein